MLLLLKRPTHEITLSLFTSPTNRENPIGPASKYHYNIQLRQMQTLLRKMWEVVVTLLDRIVKEKVGGKMRRSQQNHISGRCQTLYLNVATVKAIFVEQVVPLMCGWLYW